MCRCIFLPDSASGTYLGHARASGSVRVPGGALLTCSGAVAPISLSSVLGVSRALAYPLRSTKTRCYGPSLRLASNGLADNHRGRNWRCWRGMAWGHDHGQ